MIFPSPSPGEEREHLLLIEFPFKLRMLLSATRVPPNSFFFSPKPKAVNYTRVKKNNKKIKLTLRRGGRGVREGEITKAAVKSSWK